MRLHKWNFDRALKFVRDLHQRTDPNPGFVQQIASRNVASGRDGIPVYVGQLDNRQRGNSESVMELIDNGDGDGYIPPQTRDNSAFGFTSSGRVARGANYEPPNDTYTREGGMRQMDEPDQPSGKRWSKLTLDCPECDLPEFTSSGGGRGVYARIFS